MKKRLMSLVLAAVMLASTLTLAACNGSTDSGKPAKGARTTRDLTNVYKAEAVSTVGTVFENLRINSLTSLGDGKLLVWGSTKEDYEEKYYITDMTFQNASELDVGKAEGKNTETYIQNMVADTASGSLWYIKNVYTYADPEVDDNVTVTPRTIDGAIATLETAVDVAIDDDYAVSYPTENSNRYYLTKVDVNGNPVGEQDITAYLTVTDEDGSSYQSYIGSAVLVNGAFTFCTDTKVISFADIQSAPQVVDLKNGEEYSSVDSLFVGASGTIYYSLWGENGIEVNKLDLASGTSTKADFGGMTDNFYAYTYGAGVNGYEFIMSDENGIYGYNPSEENKTEICNFANSDIDMGYYNGGTPIFLEDGRMLICYYDYEEQSNNILLLSKVDPSMVKEKYLITVGARYLNYSVKRAFMKFNRTSDEYKIVFKDYSVYDNESNDYNGGIEQLNKDILSKTDAPDIVLIQSYGMDFGSLAGKGVFADLEKLMDADETFNKSDYLENVLEAFKYNGHLYSVSPTVSFMTLTGKKSVFGYRTGWTMTDFLEMHRSLGEGEQMFSEATRDGTGEQLLRIAMDEFIGDDGRASFDSEEFKDLLAYLKDIPADYSAYQDEWESNNNYWEEQELSYSKGTTKLYTSYVYNFNQIPEFEAYLGEEVTLIGYPMAEAGANGTLIQPNTELAITASSKVTSGAWEAIKYLLSDEYQNKFSGEADEYGNTGSYQFPIKKSMVEKKMKNDILPGYSTDWDEDGNEIRVEDEPIAWIGGTRVTLRRSTEADAARIYELISSASICSRSNEEVTQIIYDEAQAYFDGQKTVEEIVPVINSRIQILINQ